MNDTADSESLMLQVERLRELNATLSETVDRLTGAVVDLWKQNRKLEELDWLP